MGTKENTPLDLYSGKPMEYFAGARADYVNALPVNPNARILEIGCGTGDTGALALSSNKCGHYAGVEISAAAATAAQSRLSETIIGDIENIDLPWDAEAFDVVILSEVLEHLVDPWRTLRNLTKLLRGGGLVLASSPNVSHYKIILSLLRGRWELSDSGVMDRTHLRWFTIKSYINLFNQAGLTVTEVRPLNKFGWKAKALRSLVGRKLDHLLFRQISIIAVKSGEI